MARAVLHAAKAAGLAWETPSDSESVAGKGVRATVQSQTLLLGSVNWLRELTGDQAPWLSQAQHLQQSGATVSVLAQAHEGALPEVQALLVFGDEPKAEAASAIAQLRDLRWPLWAMASMTPQHLLLPTLVWRWPILTVAVPTWPCRQQASR